MPELRERREYRQIGTSRGEHSGLVEGDIVEGPAVLSPLPDRTGITLEARSEKLIVFSTRIKLRIVNNIWMPLLLFIDNLINITEGFSIFFYILYIHSDSLKKVEV